MLAKPDPQGYFNLLELLCRMAPWDTWEQDSSTLLRQGDTFRVLHALYSLMDLAAEDFKGAEADQAGHQQQQQQRPWWQLWRAVASTYASWTKAYTKTLRAVARARATATGQTATAGGAAQRSGAEETAATAEEAAKGAASGWVDSDHNERLVLLLSTLSNVLTPGALAIVSPAAADADRVRLELLLLLWGARLVAATAEHVITGPAAASGMVGSREAGFISSSTEATSRASSSSSSSSTSTECFSVSTNAYQACSGSSTSGDGKVEEAVGVSPVASNRAGQTMPDPCSNAVEQEAPERLSNFDAALKLALALYLEVVAWTKRAAEVEVATNTAGNEPLDKDERLLSQRLVHVPTSLPPSVASHMDHMCRNDMEKMCNLGRQYLARESQQGKLQLLKDLLRLCQLLMAEVPCTIGCSNPACVDLRGASEVKVSCKACTSCKVLYYCSRECQVAHWKVHKGICKKLSGSNSGGSEAKKGGGKQRAAGQVAASK